MSSRRAFNRMVGWLGLMLAVGVGGGASALAHDVREMTVDARVHPDRVELVIVVSAHFAGVILDESGVGPAVTAESFAAVRPRLEEKGRELCVLRSVGDAERVVPLVGIDVVQGAQDEVMFFLGYAAVGGEALSLAVPLLDRIDAGYLVSVRVLDAKRRALGAKALARGEASLTVPVAAGANGATKG
jgi:hypothetical protein